MGAMLPYAFSALTMKSVGVAANKMVQEIRMQFAQKRRRKQDDVHCDRAFICARYR